MSIISGWLLGMPPTQPRLEGSKVILDVEKVPCAREQDIYYSPDDDGRTEVGRVEREALAGLICTTECPFVVACLERALVTNEVYGVWGGMGEGERRKFRQHLIDEGYEPYEIPTGKELKSAMVTFYFYSDTPEEKFLGELVKSAA